MAWHCAKLHSSYTWSVEVYFFNSIFLKSSSQVILFIAQYIYTAEKSIITITSEIIYISINDF